MGYEYTGYGRSTGSPSEQARDYAGWNPFVSCAVEAEHHGHTLPASARARGAGGGVELRASDGACVRACVRESHLMRCG